MKRILITGKNSYIGASLIKWLENKEEDFYIEELDVKGEKWKEYDFSPFDTVFHVAGIAHRKENESLYFEVNRDLAFETAKKAKKDDVNQFIFLSSMSVYGMETGIIDIDTIPHPESAYGKSKLEAEQLINTLKDENFIVSIIRPPMVYGKGCKGNYPKLSKLAQFTPIFPDVNNERSMIYIDNLTEFIYFILINNDLGVFHPQNEEYVNTSEIVRLIATFHNKNIILTPFFNPIIKILDLKFFKKIFGNLKYDKELSYFKENYQIVNNKQSIALTERGNK